jgi:hypothetical protein
MRIRFECGEFGALPRIWKFFRNSPARKFSNGATTKENIMITRRDYLKLSLALGATLSARPSLLWADDAPLPLIKRPIPSTGETVPAIGLGSSATFAEVARGEDIAALREVLGALVDKGGTVFDTAPAYGASETVAGDIARTRPD